MEKKLTLLVTHKSYIIGLKSVFDENKAKHIIHMKPDLTLCAGNWRSENLENSSYGGGALWWPKFVSIFKLEHVVNYLGGQQKLNTPNFV